MGTQKKSFAVSIIVSAMLGLFISDAALEHSHSWAISDDNEILITGDAGFTNVSGVIWGLGTPDDPYVIESSAVAVWITNTTAYVIIQHMTILGSHPNLWYAGGLTLNNVSNCVVEYCDFIPAPVEDFTSISIAGCSNVTLRNNSIEKFTRIQDSVDIILESNLVLDHTISVTKSEDVDIRNSLLVDASEYSWPGWAIRVDESSYVNIDNNSIENRTVTDWPGTYGVILESSNHVVVKSNAFLNNSYQARDDYGSDNVWNSTYPLGGNFWSDYHGVDLFHGPGQDVPGADGIGDTPYSIEGNAQDSYPLVNPPSWQIGDTVPPFTHIRCDGSQGDNSWYVSSVNVTIEAFDSGGVNWTMYRIARGDWQEYAGPFEISQEGSFAIEWYSEDMSGNPSRTWETNVRIDKNPPFLNLNELNNTIFKAKNLTITWSSWDYVSGMDHFDYRLDGSYQSTNETSVTLLDIGQGTHRFTVTAFDMAGNSAVQTIYFNVTALDHPNGTSDGRTTALIIGGVSVVIVLGAVAILLLAKRRAKREV